MLLPTSKKYDFDYNIRVLDENNKTLMQQNPELLDKILNLINNKIIDNSNYVESLEAFNDVRTKIIELNNTAYEITYKDLLLSFIVKIDKSNDLKTITFIEKIRNGVHNKLLLDKEELDILSNKIQNSEMLSMFKAQLISYINDLVYLI